MRDVYRRADVARFNTLTGFALAAVLTVVVLLDGGSIDLSKLAIWVAFVGLAYASSFSREARKPSEEWERLASPRSTKLRFLRQIALVMAPTALLVAILAAADGDQWFFLPGVFLANGVGALVEWWRMARWDRTHPGALQVTDMSRWGPQRSIMR